MPFNCFLDSFITQPEEVVEKELSKLKPLNYNKFMWWRTHAQPGAPLGKPDPVAYADETGPVSWEIVVEHVKTILNNHNNANI